MSIISKLSNKQRNFLIFLILIPTLFLSFITLVKSSLDPLFYLCEDNYCGLTIEDKLIYSDWSPHVTEFGSEN